MAIEQPVLTTERLVLRPFAVSDAPELARKLNDKDISRRTLAIPFPYEEKHALEWMATHPKELEEEKGVVFATTLRDDGAIVGGVGLSSISRDHRRAEIGYWVARDSWNRGFATEAARAVVEYGFRDLGLHRIHATHLVGNPASGRVMQKLGMKNEGVSRHAVYRYDEWHDLVNYAILDTDPRP